MSFTDVFGGPNISPTLLSYLALALSADTELKWPAATGSSSSAVARKIDVTPASGGLVITMPPANQVSVGQDVMFNNVGAFDFVVEDNGGTTIGTVTAGTAWTFYVRDNSTAAGLWRSFQQGAGTSQATAASLAGLGIYASAATLNQYAPYLAKNANYTFGVGDRAGAFASTGGAITFAFDPAATLTNGWFAFVRNEGSGNLTLDPSGVETIDGAATKTIGIGESCIVVSTGTAFLTFGYGRALTNTVSAITISIAGTGNYSLSTTELASVVQNYTGLLTGNRTILLGTGAGFWMVFNNTTGAFTTTFKVDAGDAGCVVTQGSYSIIRSDGTNADIAFTATVGTVTSVATGTDLTGGPITTTGTIDHANSGVGAGTYGASTATRYQFPIATVNARGHVSSASSFNERILWNYLADLTMSRSSATVLAVAAGLCVDSTNAYYITGTAFTKSIGGAWTAGTGNNGLGQGVSRTTSTWYHVFAIINAGAYDVYFDTSVSGANAPVGTTAFRRIGSFRLNSTGSGEITDFLQDGDNFYWAASVTDFNSTPLTTPITLTVPTGVSVYAMLGITAVNSAGLTYQATFASFGTGKVDIYYIGAGGTATNVYTSEQFNVRTNTSAQITTSVAGTPGSNTSVTTYGWIDSRGKDA
jgi:hypothetical protein